MTNYDVIINVYWLKMYMDYRSFLPSWRQLFQMHCHWTGWWWMPCLVFPVSHHLRSSGMQGEMKWLDSKRLNIQYTYILTYFNPPLTLVLIWKPERLPYPLSSPHSCAPTERPWWEGTGKDRRYCPQPSWFVRLAHSVIPLQDFCCALWFGTKTRQMLWLDESYTVWF